MLTIDTRGKHKYSPLIPAIETVCRAETGQQIQIIMDDKEAFGDLKNWLSEQHIGFREIYENEDYAVQFTIK